MNMYIYIYIYILASSANGTWDSNGITVSERHWKTIYQLVQEFVPVFMNQQESLPPIIENPWYKHYPWSSGVVLECPARKLKNTKPILSEAWWSEPLHGLLELDFLFWWWHFLLIWFAPDIESWQYYTLFSPDTFDSYWFFRMSLLARRTSQYSFVLQSL